MVEDPESPVTRLLHAMGDGDAAASDELLRVLYAKLKDLARMQLRNAPTDRTLQPTALVNEAYLRLVGRDSESFENRRHFLFVAARAMHDILVEDARRKATRKRGGGWKRVDVDGLRIASEASPDEMLALSEVLESLEADDPHKAEIVRLRFFVGLSLEETAEALGVSVSTLQRQWRVIRARLLRDLDRGASGEDR